MSSPTSVLPVNVIRLVFGLSISSPPIVLPRPDYHGKNSLGHPALEITSLSKSAVSGVSDVGLVITVFPAASAGAILCASKFSGKLNGPIATTTPIGSLWLKISRFSLLGGYSNASAREHFPVDSFCFFSCKSKDSHRSRYLDLRFFDRLARFQSNRPGKFRRSLLHHAGNGEKQLGSFVSGSSFGNFRGRRSFVDDPSYIFNRGLGNPLNYLSRGRVVYFNPGFAAGLLIPVAPSFIPPVA